eukprot:6057590-Prymnesium_polylepis.1
MGPYDQYGDHAVGLLELMGLPTRGYALQPIPKLSAQEKAELTAFRSAEKASPATPLTLTEDQEVGSLESTGARYDWVKDHVNNAQQTDPHADAKFWHDCDGLCQKGG